MAVTDSADGEDVLDEVDARALTQYLTVMDDVGRVRDAPGLFLVVSESGSEYLVDARDAACECPDSQYRDRSGGCKHIRRVLFATGREAIPAWVDRDDVDDQLGQHVDGDPVFEETHGGHDG
jgi:hypothetical protein